MYGIKKLIEILKGNIVSVIDKQHEEETVLPLIRFINRLIFTNAVPKILVFKKKPAEKLWFIKIFYIYNEDICYDIWYKDIDLNRWYFENQTKFLSTDREATEIELMCLNRIVELLPVVEKSHIVNL